MPNNPEVLEKLLVKVDRAYKHIVDLEVDVTRFQLSRGRDDIFHKDNLQTQERTFYVGSLTKIPLDFSALVGDIIQNLRSTLDHLAWHLVQSSPVTQKARSTDIYFPIFETASEYRTGKMRKIQGMTDAAIQAVDAIEPYYRPDVLPGIGNGVALFWLHELNKLDKHCLLIPIWEDMTTHTMPKSQLLKMEPTLRAAFGDTWDKTHIVANRLSLPLKDGSELCTLPIAEVQNNMAFRFQIAFGEPEWVRGKEILSTLVNMHRIVKGIIEDFDSKGLL
jgi:hypothetical protein